MIAWMHYRKASPSPVVRGTGHWWRQDMRLGGWITWCTLLRLSTSVLPGSGRTRLTRDVTGQDCSQGSPCPLSPLHLFSRALEAGHRSSSWSLLLLTADVTSFSCSRCPCWGFGETPISAEKIGWHLRQQLQLHCCCCLTELYSPQCPRSWMHTSVPLLFAAKVGIGKSRGSEGWGSRGWEGEVPSTSIQFWCLPL